MVNYTLELQPKSEPKNKTFTYILALNTAQENSPESIFNSEIKESLRKTLQNQSGYKINNINLNHLLQTWIQDIREGYRLTTITLDLPLLIDDQINQVNEAGYQALPPLLDPALSSIEPQEGAFPPLNFSQ